MGDEDHAHVQLPVQVDDQFHDLGLDRDVQGGSRLIRNEQLRPAAERAGDHHALAHPAGEFVGILVKTLFRIRDPDKAEHLDGLFLCLAAGELPAVRGAGVDPHGFHDLIPAGENRVQRAQAVLKDHGDPAAAHRLHLFFRQGEKVFPFKEDLTLVPGEALLVIEAHDRLAGDRLAAAGLAHQAEDLTALHMEGDALHRGHQTALRAEAGGEVIDFKNIFGHDAFLYAAFLQLVCGSRMSRSPSPKMLVPMTARAVASPG